MFFQILDTLEFYTDSPSHWILLIFRNSNSTRDISIYICNALYIWIRSEIYLLKLFLKSFPYLKYSEGPSRLSQSNWVNFHFQNYFLHRKTLKFFNMYFLQWGKGREDCRLTFSLFRLEKRFVFEREVWTFQNVRKIMSFQGNKHKVRFYF